jgi:DNA-binding MarR family transcriptional regulator
VTPTWAAPARQPDADRYSRRDAVVICAVLRHEATTARAPTYGDLMRSTGLTRSMLRSSLRRLRAAGLVTWDDDTLGTLRSTVAIVVPYRRPA